MFSIMSFVRLSIYHHINKMHPCLPLLMTLRQVHNSPLSVPRPLSSTRITAAALKLPQLLILTLWKTNDNISLARSQRQDVDARRGTHGSESLDEWCSSGPGSLSQVSFDSNKMVVTYISGELAVIQITLEDDKLGLLELLVQLGVLSG